MNRKKWKYLVTGGPIPRRTAYRMRIKAREVREEQIAAERGKQSSDSGDEESETNNIPLRFECVVNKDSAHSEPEPNENPALSSENMLCSPSSSEEMSHLSNLSEPLRHSDDNQEIISSFGSDQESSDSCTVQSDNDLQGSDSSEERSNIDIEKHDDSLTEQTACDKRNNFPLLNNQLCPCSQMTEGDALLLCLSLGIRHNLTWVAMVDILKMINTLYGYEAVHASKYYLHKLLDIRTNSAKYHVYCSVCESYIGVKDDIEAGVVTQCECAKGDEATSFFVSVDLEEQFKAVLRKENVANEILKYRFERKKVKEGCYEDIFDGQAYTNLFKDGGILSEPNNFSYTFNTDGVQIGKSSTNAAWPIFISINELSPQNRKKNMIFAGVWVGKKQPNMRIFLKPFVNDANRMSGEGFSWTDSKGVQHQSKVIPLCCVVDSAARYKLLNMTCYSGYFGCTFCYQRAENTNKGRRFTIPDNAPSLRTHESIIRDMKEAFSLRNSSDKKKRIVRGCKGLSPLATMNYLNLEKSFIVDAMHNSFLGVIKTHTGILLNSYKFPYYIGTPEAISSISDILTSICPPTSITRIPRSLVEWKMWKASEWRSWLLFYVLVCVLQRLDSKYIEHLALFSAALYLLLQKSVSCDEIKTAHQYLIRYIFLTEKYFGKTAMLYNIHLLTHLCRGVVNFGPVWTHTAFQFEGENHHFMQMHTSPGHVAQQLVRRYSIFTAFQSLCEMYASSDATGEFISKITGKSVRTFVRDGNCVLVGKGNIYLPNPCEMSAIQGLHPIEGADFLAFQRMFYGGIRYCTSSYADGKKNDDSYVSLVGERKARIQRIFQIKGLAGSSIVLLAIQLFVRKIPSLNTSHVAVNHVKSIVNCGSLILIKPEDIVGQCIHIDCNYGRFLADIPFGCYGD